MKISIITVAFNPGDKIVATVQSVLKQTYSNYEIIVKDGCSTDGCLDLLPNDPRIKVFSTKDNGIYDAMNQAVKYATGKFLLFLNCGDILYKDDILFKISKIIRLDDETADLYYGDEYAVSRNGVIVAPDALTNFELITRTICHQCIFFKKTVFDKYYYDYNKYGLAADMALYVQCLKEAKMTAKHMHVIISAYEGGGVSETIGAKKQIIAEKKEIMKNFYSKRERRFVAIRKMISFWYLKEFMSCSRLFHGMYEEIAKYIGEKVAVNYLKEN